VAAALAKGAAQQLYVLSGWVASQLCVPGLEGGS